MFDWVETFTGCKMNQSKGNVNSRLYITSGGEVSFRCVCFTDVCVRIQRRLLLVIKPKTHFQSYSCLLAIIISALLLKTVRNVFFSLPFSFPLSHLACHYFILYSFALKKWHVGSCFPVMWPSSPHLSFHWIIARALHYVVGVCLFVF